MRSYLMDVLGRHLAFHDDTVSATDTDIPVMMPSTSAFARADGRVPAKI